MHKLICQFKPVNSSVVNEALQGYINGQYCPNTHGFCTINYQRDNFTSYVVV